MTHPVRLERQWLSADEFALVEQTHRPRLDTLSDKDRADLLKLLRERRDRAQQIASRQRREMRGKAASRGARPAADNTGTRNKTAVLAAAVQRLNKDIARREIKAARQALMDSAARALELRRASRAKTTRPASEPTPNEGVHPKKPRAPRAPRNPAKAGAVSQHTKNMQAKRDAK